jgi:hypothetical protein
MFSQNTGSTFHALRKDIYIPIVLLHGLYLWMHQTLTNWLASFRFKFQILTWERAYSLRAVWPAEEVPNCSCLLTFHDLRITGTDAFYSTPHLPVFFFIFQSDFPFSAERHVSCAQSINEALLKNT